MDLKEVCRTCLQPTESRLYICNSIQVSNLECAKIPILEILRIFTSISISSDDGPPDKICFDCLNKIRESYTFKLKFEQSDALLKQSKEIKTLNDDVLSSRNKHETELIKTKIIKNYETLYDQQFEPEITKQYMPVVQDIKQEPEIEINIEVVDFNESHSKRTEEKRFKCEQCPKEYQVKTTLTAHIRTAHGDGKTKARRYKCMTCSKLFGQKIHLNEHMRIHTGEKPFQCEVCRKEFRSKSNFTAHMQTVHADGTTNSRKFNCTACSKFFVSKYQLKRHMITHSEERPLFQCEVCLKKFRFKHNMKVHEQREHGDGTNNSQYKCMICSKLLGHKHNLIAHMRIHTGVKPFQCDVCNRKFLDKRYLNAHMQRMHILKGGSCKAIVSKTE